MPDEPSLDPHTGASTGPETPHDDGPPTYDDRWERREERRRLRAGRRAGGDGVPWIGGAVLILLGLVFLAQNLGITTFTNWWAIFILIPAAGLLAGAWRIYQEAGGQFTPAVWGPLIGGLIVGLIAVSFLFDLGLNWSLLWPLFLIVGGVVLLLQVVRR